ncbi:MAG: H-NS histone family protein [Rhodocyclaceae bacterium]|nr:H-NS histone family protein [Rhodocyclaceae bacterium]
MEIAKLSIPELKKLQKRVDAEIKKRDDTAKRDLLKKMQKLAAEHGMSIDDVVGKTPTAPIERKPRTKAAAKPKGKKSVVAPKYRNPDDATMTWTGRGRKPLWVQKCLDEGKTLDNLLIQ